MPTLEFTGKQHIYAHHLTVPYRSLETDETRTCNPTVENDSPIFHGDNLPILKALVCGCVKFLSLNIQYFHT